MTKRFFSLLFVCCLVSGSAEAGNVRLIKNTPKGCQSAGLVRAYVKDPTSFLNPKYIFGAELFAELKAKAAKLGANRIVIRYAINEQTVYSDARIWRASTYVAEAFRCGRGTAMIGQRTELPFIRSALIVLVLFILQGCSAGLNSDLNENPASLAVKIVDTEPTQGCDYVGEILSLSQHLTRHIDPFGAAEFSKKEQARHLRSYAASKGANVVVVVDHNYVDPQLKIQANTLYRC